MRNLRKTTDTQMFEEVMLHIKSAEKEIIEATTELQNGKKEVKNRLDDILALLEDFPD